MWPLLHMATVTGSEMTLMGNGFYFVFLIWNNHIRKIKTKTIIQYKTRAKNNQMNNSRE